MNLSQPLDMVVIGAGPAGLTAALYAARTGRSVVLVEQFAPGGQAATTFRIDNYPGLPHINGADLMMKMEAQVRELGVAVTTATVTGLTPGTPHTVHTSESDLKTHSIIVATGAKPRNLGIPGEETYRGKGVSYCATCDAAFFRNLPVAVVGGGNTALEEAEFLTRFASRVFVVHRREEFRADKIIRDAVLHHPKIELVTPYVPQEILGDGQRVQGLRIGLRNSPECRDLEVQGVFVFVGWTPQTEVFKNVLNLDETGYIRTDPNLATPIPGVFAAGDCRLNALKQIVVATGEGALAAMAADRYLQQALKS